MGQILTKQKKSIKKNIKNVIKNFIFILHVYLRFYVLYGWILHRKVLLYQSIVIMSWYLNNNKCLISQIEKYLFGETFLGTQSVSVSKLDRQELYILFGIGCLFDYLHLPID